jgi:hypothetical protein
MLPDRLAGVRVERDDATVLCAQEHASVVIGDAFGAPAEAQVNARLFARLGVELPEQLAADGVERANVRVPGGDEEFAAGLDRLGQGVLGAQIIVPGQREPRHRVDVDLVERAVVLFAAGAPPGRPVLGIDERGRLRRSGRLLARGRSCECRERQREARKPASRPTHHPEYRHTRSPHAAAARVGYEPWCLITSLGKQAAPSSRVAAHPALVLAMRRE